MPAVSPELAPPNHPPQRPRETPADRRPGQRRGEADPPGSRCLARTLAEHHSTREPPAGRARRGLGPPLPLGPPTPGPAGGELGDRSAPDSRLLILRAAPEYPPRRAASPRHQTGARTTPSSSLHAPPGSPRTPARTTFNNSFPAPQYSLAGRPWRRPASPSARLRPVAAVPQHPQLGQNAAHGPEGSADTTIPAAPPATIARDNVGCAELQRATMMSDIRPAVGPSMPLLSRKPNTSKAQGISPKTRRGHRIMRGPTRSRA